MDTYLPPFVEAERDALLIEIQDAFDGVSRAGGVSWSQAEVLDMYGTQKDLEDARRNDHDSCWQNLLTMEGWSPEPGIGGFSFLDPIGFRYYLPAAMTLSVRQGWDEGILFHLTLGRTELQEYKRGKWSALDERQVRCVRRYLEYMFLVTNLRTWSEDDAFLAALSGYWRDAAEGNAAKAEVPKRSKRPKRRRG